jgi:hypothetical protein
MRALSGALKQVDRSGPWFCKQRLKAFRLAVECRLNADRVTSAAGARLQPFALGIDELLPSVAFHELKQLRVETGKLLVLVGQVGIGANSTLVGLNCLGAVEACSRCRHCLNKDKNSQKSK